MLCAHIDFKLHGERAPFFMYPTVLSMGREPPWPGPGSIECQGQLECGRRGLWDAGMGTVAIETVEGGARSSWAQSQSVQSQLVQRRRAQRLWYRDLGPNTVGEA